MRIEIDVIIQLTQKTDKYFLDIEEENGIYSEMGDLVLYDDMLLEKYIQKELHLKTKIIFFSTISLPDYKCYIDGIIHTYINTTDEYKLSHRNKITKKLISNG